MTADAQVSEMGLLEHKVVQRSRRFQCMTRVSEALRPGDLETWPFGQSLLALSWVGGCLFPDDSTKGCLIPPGNSYSLSSPEGWAHCVTLTGHGRLRHRGWEISCRTGQEGDSGMWEANGAILSLSRGRVGSGPTS